MTENLILDKLDRMEKKVDKIETAIGLLAVQAERIDNLSGQTRDLWLKYDAAFGQNGIVTKMAMFQAACPKQQFKEVIARQWAVIALMATVVTGVLLKAFGISILP